MLEKYSSVSSYSGGLWVADIMDALMYVQKLAVRIIFLYLIVHKKPQ